MRVIQLAVPLTICVLLSVCSLVGTQYSTTKADAATADEAALAGLSEAPALQLSLYGNFIEERPAVLDADFILIEAPDPIRYELTDEERLMVEQAVMSEARGESMEGMMMIAQCILDGAERNSFTIAQSFEAYGIGRYTKEEPYQPVKDAVSAVFDDGERVTEEKADVWYAPAVLYSSWHEAQNYVCTIGGHKFFWCNRNAN